MALMKCPRCELNYIEEGEGYCKVCKREMKGERLHDEPELCTICNEAPALPGKDVCLFCLKEMQGREITESDETHVADESALEIDPVSTMDEIIPEVEEDIPAHEFTEIESDLSLDEIGDEEEEDNEEENEDEIPVPAKKKRKGK